MGTGCKQCGERLNKNASFSVWVHVLLCLLFLVWTTVVNYLKTLTVQRKSLFPFSAGCAVYNHANSMAWQLLAVFKVQSMVSSVGKEVFNVRCAMV